FTLEDPPGAPDQAIKQITIETGVKVQSTPGPDEDPQLYETVEEIEARVEWNTIRPRLYQPQQLATDMSRIIFTGTDTGLKQGDTLLIETLSTKTPKKVKTISADDANNTTQVDFSDFATVSPDSFTPCNVSSAGPVEILLTLPTIELIEAAKAFPEAGCWKNEDILALVEIQGWDVSELVEGIKAALDAFPSFTGGKGVYALRQKASVFGHVAVEWASLSSKLRYEERISLYEVDGSFKEYEIIPPVYPDDWEGRTLEQDAGPSGNYRYIYLEREYPEIVDGSYIILQSSTNKNVYQIVENFTLTRSDYAMSAKVSRLKVSASSTFHSSYTIRNTTVLAQSEQLILAQVPIENDVMGDSLTLDGPYLHLRTGQSAILNGERADLEGITESEVVTLKGVLIENGFTVVLFENSLKYSYVRNSVTINANVALATHGETVSELLGSGDAGQASQKSVLKQVPLTYVSAAASGGVKSTLEIRVDNVLWNEVPTLYGRVPDEHVYTTFIDDDGKVTVQFGDGINGARLTSGQNNVRATYRKGIGLGGLVKARQLNQLMTRPLGLKAAINPLPPSGADDPEQLVNARENAPLTVLTLDRTVSLQDYEDFSRAFAGIAKSLAIEYWDGDKKRILITVAGPKGAAVESGSKLHTNLSNALLGAGDPLVDFRVLSYRSAPFRIAGNIIVDPTYVEEDVLADTKSQLREAFSFSVREFGQPVMLSEVIAVIQEVPGVIAVDIDRLYRTDESETIPPSTRLNAALPEKDSTSDKLLGAELLVLDAAPLTNLGVKS
ncbi:MAG: putative baseplate assembly protein, partial [Desulforhopalus sp.]|nr:putative baseplate assembly protein [Desulforhopalus sp.]